MGIIKIASGKKVGIVTYSNRFGKLLYNTCEMYAENITLYPPLADSDKDNINAYLKDKDIILVPESYEKQLSEQTVSALHKFSGEIVNCYYEIDEGSLLYLETKINRLLDKKNI